MSHLARQLFTPALWAAHGENVHTSETFFPSGANTQSRTSAGQSVDAATALGIAAYWQMLVLISGDIGKLPRHIIQKSDGRVEQLNSHPVSRIVSRKCNPDLQAFHCYRLLIAWALSWGNGYAEIVRNNAGAPLGLFPIHPARVSVSRPSQDPFASTVVYRVRDGKNLSEITELSAREMIHIRGFGDDLVGWSLLRVAAESLGLTLATQEFAAEYFGNGAHPSGILSTRGWASTEKKKKLKAAFAAKQQGRGNHHGVVLVSEDAKFSPLTIPAEEAQLLQSRTFQVQEVARWGNMSATKLGDDSRSTFANVEQKNQDYKDSTLTPWVVTLEAELSDKLLTEPELDRGMSVRVNMNALARGDMTARGAFYRLLYSISAITPDEIRALEDMNPAPLGIGDNLFAQVNMTTLKKLVENADNPAPAPDLLPPPDDDIDPDAPGPGPPLPTRDDERGRVMAQAAGMRDVMVQAITRVLAKESKMTTRQLKVIADMDGATNQTSTLAEWAQGFAVQQSEYMLQELSPVCRVMSMEADGVLRKWAGDYGAEYLVKLTNQHAANQDANGGPREWTRVGQANAMFLDLACQIAASDDLENDDGY